MADWEQPSTTLLRKKGGNGGLEEQVESLKQQLQTANQRIAALERRLNHLESSSLNKKGFVTGA
jgi:hypothetical protein